MKKLVSDRIAQIAPYEPGKPLEEPVAWYGPIVMNTQQQLQEAFAELREGNFLKDAAHK